jgi:ankyrin repeat protein
MFPAEIFTIIARYLHITDIASVSLVSKTVNDWMNEYQPIIKEYYSPSPDDEQIMRYACVNGHINLARHLHYLGYNGMIEVASDHGQLEIVEYICGGGLDDTSDVKYALILACCNGHLSVAKYLHSQGVDIVSIVEDDDSVLLGCMKGGYEVLEFLAAIGVDVLDRANFLMPFIAAEGYLSSFMYFHDNGVDINDYGIIHKAVKADQIEVIKYLHENGCNMGQYLSTAASYGSIKTIKYLHEHGANIRSNNVLISACTLGHIDVVKYLHEQGSDVMFINNWYMRHLYANGHIDLVEYLRTVRGEKKQDGCIFFGSLSLRGRCCHHHCHRHHHRRRHHHHHRRRHHHHHRRRHHHHHHHHHMIIAPCKKICVCLLTTG